MIKKLTEMTNEELWELFPIKLVGHRDEWENIYGEEELLLKKILNDLNTLRISHIGSTAIKNIKAKDIIDILVEVNTDDIKRAAVMLEKSGFIIMAEKEKKDKP